MIPAVKCFHPLLIPLLLIATGLQGITPDATDLASPLGLRMLCQLLGDSHPWGDKDDGPDVLCGPTQACKRRDLNEMVDRFPVHGFAPEEHETRKTNSRIRKLTNSCNAPAGSHRPTQFLCQFNL